MNLIYREEEREMLPFCVDQGIAVLPWSPLARGRLTRAPDATTDRKQTDTLAKKFYDSTDEADQRVINKVAEIAENRGVPRAQVALAWLIQMPSVTSPIIGASKPHHLDDAIAALSLSLTPDEISALESFYQPHPVAGFS
jgi:aryl-alcohol dehydrogenase-like predicted oxidoreductase